ncbi:NADH-quinone oxidoreductase subunit L [Marivivens sp. JLT3646]|jgi:NADH-quinone oxidoreductase subunit L|uniref:NADH-quinone oxidoreductase subunit L n=1 Tax=Marivivens sp. JLT3646 TaxID=1920883 RepID=UPI0007FF3A01|nr:NADH-quinone oxidoreductase subunit L [Marivivens sp. JLT3646]APO86411.1 NADH-quinone oxidoreductase subunit L [Marivivens sp. JLT3646]OBR37798.1 NADH-quinone oxidoreductase subunit L [Donghicola sp. JL3646]
MEKFILLAPFVGSLIAGFGWRFIGEKGAQWLTTGILFLCAALSWVLFLNFDGQAYTIHLLDWINSGTLSTDWAIRIDRLTVIMLIVVNTVSSLVHLYSMGYMAHDENWGHHEHYKARFFAYLSFFTFAMLMLVTSDNLVQMFFGWEGVGVASYLLIGFYYKKPSANAAAMKAFVVNRVGDFGFALGIFGLYMLTDSIQFDVIFDNAPHLAETQLHFLWSDWNAANLLAFLLFVGAMGKSAQLILHTWLPDAMEGPTPVSALIHAATMVTAGVFLVCRMSPLFEYAPETKSFIMYLGAATAFFAATVGLVQNDIKRVIAYSTCSQLGYMFVAAGAGIYGAAMFHLFTHAFFKAMLFLGAGSVIHAMHHEQDMRNYGNLRKKIPFTFWAMMIGTLAITGVGIPLTYYGFAGFLSKDAIIESAYASGNGFAFWALVIAALFTSFYSWRLMFMTFYGQERGDHHAHEHAHESPLVMLVPLGVLAMGAIFAGMIWLKPFFGDHEKMTEFFGMPHHVAATEEGAATDHAAPAAEHGATDAAHGEVAADASHAAMAAEHHGAERGAIYMSDASNEVLDAAHHSPVWVKVSPFIAMLIGFVTAWVMYIRKPHLPAQLAANQAPLYNFLLNKWYFDELYDFVFVQPAKAIGRFFWKRGDEQTIDGGINGLAMGIVPFLTKLAGRAQSGYVFTYAFAMVLGIAVILTWVTLTGGSH